MPGINDAPAAGRGDPRAGGRGRRDAASAASACTCAARCASVFFDWLRVATGPTCVERYEQLYARGAYAAAAPSASGSAALLRGAGAARGWPARSGATARRATPRAGASQRRAPAARAVQEALF